MGEILNEEERVENDDDLEGLTAEEISAILDELDNFDEVEEADIELKNVDEDLEFLEILTVRRLPCTAHKVRIKFIVYRTTVAV